MVSKLCNCVLKLALTPSLDPSVPTVVLQGQPAVFSVTVILQIAGQRVWERHSVPQKHLTGDWDQSPLFPHLAYHEAPQSKDSLSAVEVVLCKTQSFSIAILAGKSQRLMQEMIQTLFLTSIMAKDADCLRKICHLWLELFSPSTAILAKTEALSSSIQYQAISRTTSCFWLL